MNNKIDFVILWVDGNDEKWLNEKRNYSPKNNVTADTINRFRDWENLKYWFRGVEKFAPWVNNIYFITYGHLPSFLNVNHPKLKIIKHSDFMKKDYLPTYNSSAIELNINKIPELSEKFVLFNDDMFIIDNVKEEDFFKNNLPCDEYAENPVEPYDDEFPYMLFNNIKIINENYDKRKRFKENIPLYLNYKYGIRNLKTILLLPWRRYLGFHNPHIPQSFLKSYFDKLWKISFNDCEITSLNKFRTKEDITQYAVRYMQLVEGKFIPRNSKFGKLFVLDDNTIDAVKHIKNQKTKVICLNDVKDMNFEKVKKEINDAFEKILPNKSSFEK